MGENEDEGQDDPRWHTVSGEGTEQTDFTQERVGLDSDADVNRRTIQEQLRTNYELIEEAGGELRPHIRFPFDRDEFEAALDRVLEEDYVILEHQDRDIVLEECFGHGTVTLSTHIRQDIEDVWLMGDDESRMYVGSETPAEALEHYDGEAPHLQKPLKDFPDWYYVTLLRDMNEECARAVDSMHDVVDNRPDLYWGGEPTMQNLEAGYGFSTTLYVRSE